MRVSDEELAKWIGDWDDSPELMELSVLLDLRDLRAAAGKVLEAVKYMVDESVLAELRKCMGEKL